MNWLIVGWLAGGLAGFLANSVQMPLKVTAAFGAVPPALLTAVLASGDSDFDDGTTAGSYAAFIVLSAASGATTAALLRWLDLTNRRKRRD